MSQLPYPGLRPFQRDEADIFFGRDEQVQQLLDKLQGKRFLAVVGQSGCGKSSLIFTGLLNALDAGMLPNAGLHWRVANLHPGEHPMLNLAKALVEGAGIGADINPAKPVAETSTADTTAASGNNPIRHDPAAFLLATLRRGPLGIVETLREKPLPAETNLLILVDQFEEIFRYRKHQDRDEADAFIALLLRTVSESLANADGFPVYVVITMRSDFLGDCALFPNLPEALNDSQFLTPRLSRDQRRMAIIGPAKVFSGDVEPALVNRLLNDMGADPDQLPVLQHALMRLWTQAVDSGGKPVVLKLKDYEELGGWDNTLSNHADAAYNELNPAQQAMAVSLFKALSERSAEKRDTRRPATLQTIADIAQVKPEELIPVIEVFRKPGRSFLKPPPPQTLTSEALIDISHESLIRQWQSMKGWVIQEAQSADTYRRLEQTALLHQNKRADYLKGLEFQSAVKWKNETQPNAEWAKRYGQDFELAMEFLGASEVREKIKHIGKILLIALVVVTAIAMTYLKQQADFEKRKVESWRLLADAERIRTHDASKYPLSALLAIEAEKIFPEPSDNLNKFLLDSIGMMEKPLQTLPHQGEVSTAVYSQDGKWLATIDGNKIVKIWDAAGGNDKAIHDFNHDHTVTSVIFSPDGQKLATVSDDNMVRLWDTANGTELMKLSHKGYIHAIGFSPDGKKLATGGDDNAAQLWDAVSGKELKRLKHNAAVKAVAFNKDGLLLATAGADNLARLWDVAGLKEIKSMEHEDSINAVSFSPDGKWLATASSDSTVKLWEVAGNKFEPFKTLNHDYAVKKVMFSPDSSRLATSTDDRVIWLWETATGKESNRLRHDDYVTGFVFSPDGRQIATASYDKTARIWPVYGGSDESKESKRLNHDDVVTSVSFSPDGRQLATASKDKTANLWSASGGQEFNKLKLDEPVFSIITFIPNGQQFAVLGRENDNSPVSVSLKSLADGKEIRRFSQKIDITLFSFSPDGQRLATVDEDGIVHLWDVDGGMEVNQPKQLGKIIVIKFSADGKKLLTVNVDNQTVRLLDVLTGNVIWQLKSDSGFQDLSFSPDGKWLATGHQDYSVRLWALASPKEIRRFKDVCYLYDIDISPDGEKIAAACGDNTARLWDINDDKKVEHLHHIDEVTKVRFSPDGKQLLTASRDKALRLWDVADGKELQMMRHTSWIQDIDFSADGRQVITGDRDGFIRFWHWHPEDLANQLCGKLSHNLGWGEWQVRFEGQPYRKTCDKLSIDLNQLMETGRKLLASEKKDEALRMIKELNAIYPKLHLDPEREIQVYSAPKVFQEALELINHNKIKDAAAKYYQVEKLDSDLISASDWNDLCWDGAMQQAAAEVKEACDKAVDKAENDDKFKYLDSRGIVLALTGDLKGAIKDFEFFIKEAGLRNEYADISKQRQEWVNALKAGHNPLTKEVLESIKDQ